METIVHNKKILNTFIVILAVGLLISIIPIVVSSVYSHPVADDFGFSEKVYRAVKDGGGFYDILSASFKQVKKTYFEWQGTYAAVFIFSLQPAAFSEKLYFLTSVVMLTSLMVSTVFFVDTIFGTLGFNKKYGLIVSLIILLLSIHFVVDKNQAFFWWNGCAYYTLFYSFSLIFFSFLIKLTFTDNSSLRVIYFIISLLFSAIIGGGNYSTALLTAVILSIATVAVFKTKKKIVPYFLSVSAVLMAGFIISMIAPGNSVRAALLTGNSAVKAILRSVLHAFKFIAQWTGLAQIAGFIIIAIIAAISTKSTKCRFKYPVLVLIFSFLVFATQLTPPLYAMGNVGAGRQVNIYYYAYYLLISFNIFYFCGWLNQKEIVKIEIQSMKKSYALCSCLMIVALLFGGCFSHGIHDLTFVDTLLALKNGTPQAYSDEYVERITEIKNGNTEISDVETVPDFFQSLNIEEDSTFWINRQIARYYDVEKITLKTQQ